MRPFQNSYSCNSTLCSSKPEATSYRKHVFWQQGEKSPLPTEELGLLCKIENCVLKINPITFTRFVREFYIVDTGEGRANKIANKAGKISESLAERQEEIFLLTKVNS